MVNILVAETHGILLRKPINIGVIVGDNAVLECKTNRTNTVLEWHYTAPSSNLSKMVIAGNFRNKSFDQRYIAYNYVGELNLKIIDIQLMDAGAYKCEESGTLNSFSADLSIIGIVVLCFFSTIIIIIFHKCKN